MKQTFNFTEEQVLTIITALGVLKNRIGYRARWLQHKRMNTLRGRLADCITIGDEIEAECVRRAMSRTQRDIDRRVNFVGGVISDLMNEIKQGTSITDEHLLGTYGQTD